jgi:glycosyltransferase involved in cell wall biosynthesis
MPRVSVVITARNARAHLAATLDSILAQSYRDLEVVVVDGGSTDGTVELVARYGAPIRLITGGTLTKSAGRNLGIRAADAEFIALVDSDDWWAPGKLDRQLDYFRDQPSCQWVYSDCHIFDEDSGRVSGRWSARHHLHAGPILQPLLFGCFVPSPTPLIRRRVFDRVGAYDESFLRHEPEDWDLWLRIGAVYPAGLVREPLAYLRVHAESLTSREDLRLTAAGALAVVERTFTRRPELPPGLRARVRAHWYRSFGRGLTRRRQYRDARPLFLKAIHERPLQPAPYLWWAGTWLLGAVPIAGPPAAADK